MHLGQDRRARTWAITVDVPQVDVRFYLDGESDLCARANGPRADWELCLPNEEPYSEYHTRRGLGWTWDDVVALDKDAIFCMITDVGRTCSDLYR